MRYEAQQRRKPGGVGSRTAPLATTATIEWILVSLPLGRARSVVYAGVTELYSRIRAGRTSYSQFAEDLLVIDFFKFRRMWSETNTLEDAMSGHHR